MLGYDTVSFRGEQIESVNQSEWRLGDFWPMRDQEIHFSELNEVAENLEDDRDFTKTKVEVR